MATEEQHEKPLSIREKIAIKILFLVITVVKPSRWDTDWKKVSADIEEMLKQT